MSFVFSSALNVSSDAKKASITGRVRETTGASDPVAVVGDGVAAGDGVVELSPAFELPPG